jgi:hypothetical protein
MRIKQIFVMQCIFFLWLLPSTTGFATDCAHLIDQDPEFYIAASSLDRGYAHRDLPAFQESMHTLIISRAEGLCRVKGCGPLQGYRTEEIYREGILFGSIAGHHGVKHEQFTSVTPWEYGGWDYYYLGNGLWYFGHCVSALASSFAVMGRQKQIDADDAINICLGLAVTGQVITMISRVVERLGYSIISHATAMKRKTAGTPVIRVHENSTTFIPHLRFDHIQCDPAADAIP